MGIEETFVVAAISRPLLNSIGVVLLSAVLTFLAATFWWRARRIEVEKTDALIEAKRLAAEHKELVIAVQTLKEKLAVVERVAEPLNAMMQAALIKELTHMHTPEMDALLVKLGPPNLLTDEDEARLAKLLIERSNDLNGRIDELEREAAIMLPMVIKRAKREYALLQEASTIKLVPVIVAPEDSETEPPAK